MADTQMTPQVAPTPSVLPTTTANVQNFLQSYQPTAQQVYSPTNVQQATTAPAKAPNLADPLGLYSYYMNTPEVTQAQTAYQNLQQKLSQFDTGTQQAQIGLENQPISLNVIRGEQAQLGQQAAATRQGLASQALVAQSAMEAARQTAQDKLNLALSQRSELTNLITQYPGAKISYADTIESASKKITKYQDEQAKQAYKDTLKQTAMQLGIKTKGSTKDIEKRLKKYYGDEQTYKKQVQALELAAKQKALAGTSTGGQSMVASKTLANAQSALLSSRGSDMKADPNVYMQQRQNYMNAGGSGTDFDSQFAGLLSQEQQQNLGISTVSTRAVAQKSPILSQNAIDDAATMNVLKQYAINLSTKDSLAGVGPFGYGTAAGFLTDVGFGTEEGQQNRDIIGNIQGTIAKLRGGTSFTPTEQRLLETYTPTINDSEMKIKQKLEDLANFINDKQLAMQQLSGINYGGSQETYQKTQTLAPGSAGTTASGLKYTVE